MADAERGDLVAAEVVFRRLETRAIEIEAAARAKNAESIIEQRESFYRDVQAGRADARSGNLLSEEEVFTAIEREIAEIEARAKSR